MRPEPVAQALKQPQSELNEDVDFQRALWESCTKEHSINHQREDTEANPPKRSRDELEEDDEDDPDLREAIRMSLMSDDDSADSQGESSIYLANEPAAFG